MTRDRVYALPREQVGDFTFDQAVVDVFPDMIARSVPGYASILSMIEQLAQRFIIGESHVYDLGCSLGAATLVIRRHAPPTCTIYAIDNAPAMVQRLKANILAHDQPQRESEVEAERCPVEIHEADVRAFPMTNASFIVLNFTLQFIPPAERHPLLQRIFDALNPGGALLMSEKISFESPVQNRLMAEFHHEFKRAHGYSELEISQKRAALETQLVPEPLSLHHERLNEIGFATTVTWFQCFNFASIVAIKT